MVKCEGIAVKINSPCSKRAISVTSFCGSHQHLKDFPIEQYKDIKKCSVCNYYNYLPNKLKRCSNCRCKGINQKKGPCIRPAINGTGFCGTHEYMKDYTKEQMDNLTKCTGRCRNWYYLPDNTRCQGCRNPKNREPCKAMQKDGVTSCNKYVVEGNDDYYKLHMNLSERTEEEQNNLKKCSGCGNNLPNLGKHNTCEKCRERSKKNREKAKESYVPCKFNSCKYKANLDYNNGYCGKHQTEAWRASVEAEGKKVCSNYIRGCRTKLNLDYKYSRCKACLDDTDYRLRECKRAAEKRNIIWELTDEYVISLIISMCFYCNCNATGIDKFDNDKGYVRNNTVPCCKTCNVMKNTLSACIFLRRCEHILTHQGLINGTLDYTLWVPSKPRSYNGYKKRAEDHGLDFTITREEYNDIIFRCCYMCGRESNGEHVNGIDRVDNSLGYATYMTDDNVIVDNCEACCTECNLMKNNHDHDVFLEKLYDIYVHCISNQGDVIDGDEITTDTDKYDSYKLRLKETGIVDNSEILVKRSIVSTAKK